MPTAGQKENMSLTQNPPKRQPQNLSFNDPQHPIIVSSKNACPRPTSPHEQSTPSESKQPSPALF